MSQKQKEKKSRISIVESFKMAFEPGGSERMFPWLQSGLILIGFSLGVLVTTSVDLIALVVPSDSVNEEVSLEEQCRERGGRFDQSTETCSVITNDRGTECYDNGDCEGWCLAPKEAELGEETIGTCSEAFDLTGCINYMDEGSVNSICKP